MVEVQSNIQFKKNNIQVPQNCTSVQHSVIVLSNINNCVYLSHVQYEYRMLVDNTVLRSLEVQYVRIDHMS